MFNKLTSRARAACNYAGSEAINLKATSIGSEHLLLGLLISDDSHPFIISLDDVREVSQKLPTPLDDGPTLSYSQEAMNVIRMAASMASDGIIDTSHLWRALLHDRAGNACVVLEQLEVDVAAIQTAITELLGDSSKSINSNQTSATEGMLTNLCQLAHDKKLSPVIGRQEEMNQVMTTLVRWSKNAPVLVGPAGVGKTAVVEGLAQRMAIGDVPEQLQGCEIVALNLGAMVAGTKYRGDLEGRVQELFNQLTNNPHQILFIDELHTVLGAGASEGSMDISGLMKPLLARGDLRIIGATTDEEYSRKLEKDPAFERRLQKVEVAEPSKQETVEILKGIRSSMQEHHGVKITSEALQLATGLSSRYLTTRQLPDKAVDVVDQASAIASLTGQSLVDQQQIAEVIAAWTGVASEDLFENVGSNISGLQARIEQHLVGQRDAIEAVSSALLRQSVGLGDEQRPLGGFLFCGPTGVGKTELARILAREVFSSERALVRLDMSEYSERHDASRLIGSPPGYTGHSEGGQLVNIMRQQPSCVLVFDEIEKAHPDVAQLLLQILEEGELQDGRGRKASFRNAIIILTSNLGARWSNHGKPQLGFAGGDVQSQRSQRVLEDLRSHFAPELLGRLDEIVVFNQLQEEQLQQVMQLQLDGLKQRLQRRNIKLQYSKTVLRWLMQQYQDGGAGARGLKILLRSQVEDALAQVLAAHPTTAKSVRLSANKTGLQIKVT